MTGKPKLVILSDCREREDLIKATRDSRVVSEKRLRMTGVWKEIATSA
jgi:hypothetical protein